MEENIICFSIKQLTTIM